MKKILLFLTTILFVGCVSQDDGLCGCEAPPESDEQLRISLVNNLNQNLLSETTTGYLADSLFTFYMLTNNKVMNLTQLYKNSSFITDLGTTDFSNKIIVLEYSWYLNSNSHKEGSYVIDYGGVYSNDTIYLKYLITERNVSDKIIEVKLNGVLQEIDSIDGKFKKLVIVK